MFRLFAVIAVVLVVGFIWWATRKIGENNNNNKPQNPQ